MFCISFVCNFNGMFGVAVLRQLLFYIVCPIIYMYSVYYMYLQKYFACLTSIEVRGLLK